jgi:hypothetical protein
VTVLDHLALQLSPSVDVSWAATVPCRYVTAMYWAYTTMTTVGYGDISSSTVAEKLWAITVMIFSGFFFSYTISRMSALVSKLDADRQVSGACPPCRSSPLVAGRRVLVPDRKHM